MEISKGELSEVRHSLKKTRLSIWLFPFLVLGFNQAYFYLFLLGISGFRPEKKGGGDFLKHFSYGSGIETLEGTVSFFLGLILVIWWGRVFSKALGPKGIEPYRNEIKNKIENLSLTVTKLIGLMALTELTVHLIQFYPYLKSEIFLDSYLPAFILNKGVLWSFALVYVYILVLGTKTEFFKVLYSGEELFHNRSGLKLTTLKQVALLLIFNGVLPIGSISCILYRQNFEISAVQGGIIWYCLFYSMVITLVSIGFLFHAFHKPILRLVEKMEKVSHGDFSIRSAIFLNDEMSDLKMGFNKMVNGLESREKIKEMFGKYLSFEIAEKLLNEKNVKLGGEEISAAVLFCDIRNFTPLSEKMTAVEVVEFLNRYFSYVTLPIQKEGGVINKFIGDAIMAVFSPVFGCQNYSDAACRAALGMRKSLVEFNQAFPEYHTQFGIGLHSGSLVAGNIGTNDRLEYTVIGDTVNLSSRIESFTKEKMRDILLSLEFVQSLSPEMMKGLDLENMGEATLKGKSKPVGLWFPKNGPEN